MLVLFAMLDGHGQAGARVSNIWLQRPHIWLQRPHIGLQRLTRMVAASHTYGCSVAHIWLQEGARVSGFAQQNLFAAARSTLTSNPNRNPNP